MLFNDIRLKTYVEIRPADAMPIDYVIGYAALIKGMFSSDKSMSALEAVFEGARTEADVVKAKEELMSNGYDAEIYGQRADQIADRMCMIARLGLAKEERDLIEPLLMLVMSRKTIAELTIIE
jgi:glutamate--cysteine ligase